MNFATTTESLVIFLVLNTLAVTLAAFTALRAETARAAVAPWVYAILFTLSSLAFFLIFPLIHSTITQV